MESLFDAYEDWAADRIVLKVSLSDGPKHGASMHFDMRVEAARTLGLALLNAVAKYDNLNAGLVQQEKPSRKFKKGDKVRWKGQRRGEGVVMEDELCNGYVKINPFSPEPIKIINKTELELVTQVEEPRRKFKKGDRARWKESPNAVYMEGIAQEDEWDNGYVKLKTPQYPEAVVHHEALELVLEKPIKKFKVGDKVSFWDESRKRRSEGTVCIDEGEDGKVVVDAENGTTHHIPIKFVFVIPKEEPRRKFKKGDKVRWKEGPNAVYTEGIAQEDERDSVGEWDNGYVKIKIPIVIGLNQQCTDFHVHSDVLELVAEGEQKETFKEGDRVISVNLDFVNTGTIRKTHPPEKQGKLWENVLWDGNKDLIHWVPRSNLRKLVLCPLQESPTTHSALGALVWLCAEQKVGVVEGISPFRPNGIDVNCGGVLISSSISNLMGIK